jgi:hypothetical protein
MARAFRPFVAAALFVVILLVLPSSALADTTGVGGVVTGMTSRGNDGFLSARVTNPFNVAVSGYINFSTINQDGTTTTVNYTYTLGAYGTQDFVGLNYMRPFNSSTIGAQVTDAYGQNSATGYGTSYINGQPCGGPHQPVCPKSVLI